MLAILAILLLRYHHEYRRVDPSTRDGGDSDSASLASERERWLSGARGWLPAPHDLVHVS